MLPDENWHLHRKVWTFFSIIVLRMFWRTIVICVVYSDLKKLICQNNRINLWAFSFDHFLHCGCGLSPSYSTVKNWFNEFSCERRSLKDEVREDAPKTAVVSENIDAVRELIMQDLHVTYREMAACLGVSSTSIYSILHWTPGRKNDPTRFSRYV